MKRMIVLAGLLLGLACGVAQAQTRIGVSLSFGRPYPYHRYYSRPFYHSSPYYYHYRPAPLIVVEPRFYRAPRVVVVRPYRYHRGRYHHGW